MKETRVARRYAHALFNTAVSKNTVDIIASELFQLKTLCDKDKTFIQFLWAPQVLTEHKIAVIKLLFTTRLSQALLSFLFLLIEKRRIEFLRQIADEYEKFLEDYKGLIKAKVVTAVVIDEDFKNRLKEKLENISGKKIEIIHKIDKSILGGIIVHLNNQVIDRSIRYQLNTLRHDLMAIKVH